MAKGRIKPLKQKYRAQVYQLTPLASGDPSVHPSAGRLWPTEVYSIVGEIEDHLVVSIPTSTTHNTAKLLRDKLVEVAKKPVLIVTDNIHFLQVNRLQPKDALRVIKRAEAGVAQRNRIAEALENTDGGSEAQEEEVGNGDSADGDGS